ncbi:MAG: beta-galactosidase, partial [Dehalococcoidales bacterium]|nr:beta-galactosidase [Dehalococcoidales bacterium]
WKEVNLTGVKMLLNPWEIAPLPGFVRTRSLDERLRFARQYGLIAVMAPTPPNHRWDPEWLPWECQEDYQGLTHWRQEAWNCQHFPDHNNPIYRDLVRRILVKVYDHIKNDMDVVAWNYQTDIFFVDHGGGFAGYSVSSQEAFRRFLREKLALSLTQVNERYGSEYASWNDVMIPMPGLDRKAWNSTIYYRDAMAFKSEVVREFYVDFFTGTLQAEGDTRPTS